MSLLPPDRPPFNRHKVLLRLILFFVMLAVALTGLIYSGLMLYRLPARH